MVGRKATVLVGPRVTLDVGLQPRSDGSGTFATPYGTFGATVGIVPHRSTEGTRLIVMIEPAYVLYSRDVPNLALAVTLGALL